MRIFDLFQLPVLINYSCAQSHTYFVTLDTSHAVLFFFFSFFLSISTAGPDYTGYNQYHLQNIINYSSAYMGVYMGYLFFFLRVCSRSHHRSYLIGIVHHKTSDGCRAHVQLSPSTQAERGFVYHKVSIAALRRGKEYNT